MEWNGFVAGHDIFPILAEASGRVKPGGRLAGLPEPFDL